MANILDGRELAQPAEAHRLDERVLAQFLAKQIPEFDGDCKIQQFLGGQSNPTYLVEADSGSYVLRKKPPGRLLPSAHAVDREYRVMTALTDSAVPVPRTRLLCEDESVIGQMFYVMDYVPGRVFSDLSMPGCTADDRRAMYLSMADIFAALHAVDYLAIGLGNFGKPSAYVSRQVARWSQQYEASKINECEAMDRLIDWLPANDPDDGSAAIVHGDYRPGNIIFGNDVPEVVAVLDWELSTIGHPLADLGYFLMPYRLDTSSSAYGILGMDLDAAGIPTERELLQAYADRSGMQQLPEVDFYIVFAMFRLAAILAGVLKRGLDGNAADPRAVERGQTFTELANAAWAIARRAD